MDLTLLVLELKIEVKCLALERRIVDGWLSVRVEASKMLLYREQPSPLCFPLLVDSLNRDRISNESISERVKRMLAEQMGD